MRLPKIDDFISPYRKFASVEAGIVPITGPNVYHNPQTAHAEWIGNTLTLSKDGTKNYWFLPGEDYTASYCVVPCTGGGLAYVISDQYGGCEYHTLHSEILNAYAFVHVYRDKGKTTQYGLAGDWKRVNEIRSMGLVRRRGLDMRGANLSVSCIDRNSGDPSFSNTFVTIAPPMANASSVKFRVTMVDDGTAPNASAIPVEIPGGDDPLMLAEDEIQYPVRRRQRRCVIL